MLRHLHSTIIIKGPECQCRESSGDDFFKWIWYLLVWFKIANRLRFRQSLITVWLVKQSSSQLEALVNLVGKFCAKMHHDKNIYLFAMHFPFPVPEQKILRGGRRAASSSSSPIDWFFPFLRDTEGRLRNKEGKESIRRRKCCLKENANNNYFSSQ